jgi:hypothetical protein
MDEISHPEAGTLYVDRSAGRRGSKGKFFVVYTDEDASSRWGYFCDNCETTDNAVDSMGRIQCNECSNVTKPEEWDAAHE